MGASGLPRATTLRSVGPAGEIERPRSFRKSGKGEVLLRGSAHYVKTSHHMHREHSQRPSEGWPTGRRDGRTVRPTRELHPPEPSWPRRQDGEAGRGLRPRTSETSHRPLVVTTFGRHAQLPRIRPSAASQRLPGGLGAGRGGPRGRRAGPMAPPAQSDDKVWRIIIL